MVRIYFDTLEFLSSSKSNLMYLPFRARASTILKGYFCPGVILTVVRNGSPRTPYNLTRFGLMSTNFSTNPNTDNVSFGCASSLVSTYTFSLILLPPYPCVDTVTVIFPSPPGGICLALEAAVQPHPVRILTIFSGAFPLFCKRKSCTTFFPSRTGSNS